MAHIQHSEDPTLASGGPPGDAPGRGLFEGRIISLRYRVGRLIGMGGMGLVYEGTHLLLGTRVAIKILRPEWGESSEMCARFEREARVVASLRGDHVVRLFDAGRLDTGLPFLIMERLEGADLRAVAKLSGPLAPRVVADYATQVCRGLAEAHALGLVHRDIKPANLFLAAQGGCPSRIKILDFGIATLDGHGAAAEARSTAEVLGSPAYLSPEQLGNGKPVDGRADLWSLGVVMFELLTGICPFREANAAATCSRVLFDSIPSIREILPELDPRLERVIQRCLRRNPAERFASSLELEDALRSFASRRRASASARDAGLASQRALH
jgi:eukaryotic-like serine/threonine-protein kinase